MVSLLFTVITKIMLELNKIYCGNCLDIMKDIDDNSIDLVVTSPPYDNLRGYGGYEFDFENIAKQLFRVMKKGGVIIWVVGDATIKGSETGSSFRQALFFKEIGFNLHDTMIYKKLNPIPLTHNRYEQAFEYMFVFSKKKPRTFNPIMVDCKSYGKSWSKNKLKSSDRLCSWRIRREKYDYRKRKQASNIFEYALGVTRDNVHPAPFPEKLAEDQIISWSNEGDLILDPMCGSGTTCKIAKKLGRNYIGIDISKEYCKIAEERLSTCPR